MVNLKMAAMSVAFIGSLCGVAFAQGDSGGADPKLMIQNSVTFTTTDGRIVSKVLAPDTMDEIMKHGVTPMTAGVMTMMHDGKMFMVTDHKMPNGTMMSDFALPGMIKK